MQTACGDSCRQTACSYSCLKLLVATAASDSSMRLAPASRSSPDHARESGINILTIRPHHASGQFREVMATALSAGNVVATAPTGGNVGTPVAIGWIQDLIAKAHKHIEVVLYDASLAQPMSRLMRRRQLPLMRRRQLPLMRRRQLRQWWSVAESGRGFGKVL